MRKNAIIVETIRDYKESKKHLSCLKVKAVRIADSMQFFQEALRATVDGYSYVDGVLQPVGGGWKVKCPTDGEVDEVLLEIIETTRNIGELENSLRGMGYPEYTT